MPRDFQIQGESMVFVKGHVASYISGTIRQLGLATDQIQVSPHGDYNDLIVNAWGKGVVDTQFMLGYADITMNLIHFDITVLQECMRLSWGAPTMTDDGQFPHAGQRLGGGLARFANGNNYIGLNIMTAAQLANSYRFHYCHLTEAPVVLPLGNEAQIAQLHWRAVPYTQDPFGVLNATDGTTSGTGALGYLLWDHQLDT